MHRNFPVHFRHFISGAVLLILLAAISADAETLQKYREDIDAAKKEIVFLGAVTSKDVADGWTQKELASAEQDFTSLLENRLPERESVEWQGVTTEVDNRWLHERFADLQKLPSESEERDNIVSELDERLSALSAKLTEIESAGNSARNKSDEKDKIDQILQRPEYQTQQGPKEQTALERWMNALLDWFSSLLPRNKPSSSSPEVLPSGGVGFSPVIVQVLIAVLALAVLAFVAWRVAPLFGLRGGGKKEKKDKGERIILGERLAANESSSTLFDQADVMAREGNFRGAIRKGYIALLCELGDRKIVRIEQHKTNRDYLRDVQKNQSLYGGVKDLTFMFETHWYGLSDASEEEWTAFREHYQRTHSA